MLNKIDEFIRSEKAKMLDALSKLAAVPSVMGAPEDGAPFGREPKRALEKMREICDNLGFKTTVYGDAVICADYLPEGCETPELGILAHLDVVPVSGDGWDTNPFELTEKDGVLFGRGTIDDKGPAVAALWALYAVKKLGIPLKKGVRLIFGTDEENGSEDLEIYKKFDKFPPKVFTPDGSFPVINIEKGMLRSRFSGKLESGVISFNGGNIPNAVPDNAEAKLDGDVSLGSAVLAGEKLGVDNYNARASYNSEDGKFVEITVSGKAAHASTPETGVNAVTELLALINRMTDNNTLRGLENLFPFGETDGNSLGLRCSDKSGALTCVLSTLHLENGTLSGTVDIRFPICTDLESVKSKLSAALREIGLEYEMILSDEPHAVPGDSEFVQKLLSVYERVEGEKGKCVAIGGGTYVHNIEGGVAFGAERGGTDYHMHGDNEFITVEELLKDSVLFAAVIAEVCG